MNPTCSLALQQLYHVPTWKDTDGTVWCAFVSALHFKGTHGWAVGSGQILHSTNSGLSWENKVPPEIAHGVSIPERVFTVDQRSVWVLLLTPGANNCYYSANAGREWMEKTIASVVRPRDIFFVNQRVGWILSDDGQNPAGDPMIHITHDAGNTWDSYPLEIKGVGKRVKFITPRKGLLIQHTTNDDRTRTICNILSTNDGGHSWTVLKSFNRYISDVCMVTENYFLVAGEGGFISRSADGGMSWKRSFTKTREAFNAIEFNNSGKGAAGGDFGLLMVSENYGKDWVRFDNACTSDFVDLSFTSNDHLLMCASTGIYLLSFS